MPSANYPTRLILMLATFLALILVGTSGYHWLEGMSFVDALYMTVITVSTVGFGEVRELSAYGRIFTMALILGGGGTAAYSLSIAAEFMLSGEWRIYWKKRRLARMVANLSDHIIVCGYGRVGKKVSSELYAEGIPFIVLDDDDERIANAQEHGYLSMKGNAAKEDVLHQAGIDSARGLVSAVDSDAENVFIVLTARGLHPTLNIVARANYEDSEPKLLRAGANRTLVPYYIGGKRLVTMLLRPNVADFLDEVSHASGMEFLIEEIPVGKNSPLAGKTISESQLRNLMGVAVLACRNSDGKLNTHPNSDTVIEPNGLLLALGTRDQLRELLKMAKGE